MVRPSFRLCHGYVVVAMTCLYAATGSAVAEAPKSSLAQLADMSLEDLVDVEISSVSKRTEKRRDAAAAVHVITPEMIRRSTATSIPGLLRTVPGIHVARLDANKWSVSSRGFSGRYANSLLVLIDGRSVYTPFFSGVYWETRDVMLENVERIEIIRGSGGSLWGANAVNGVINIVTKAASDTQGGMVTIGGGTEEEFFTSLRYGGTVGEDGHYRVYGEFSEHDDGAFESGDRANDAWLSARIGTRFDWEWDDSHLTLQGDLFGVDTSQTYATPSFQFPYTRIHDEDSYFSGGNLLGRWRKRFANDAELTLQGYYDRSESNIFTIDEDRNTFDLEVQYQLPPRQRHEILVGAGLRYIDDRTDGTDFVSVSPESQRRRLLNVFIQDRITLIENRLLLTAGTKLEYNDFTGIEIQPSLRLAWTPNDQHTVWAAISRAVRTPSLVEDGGRVASQGYPRILVALVGEDFESEELLSFELGYRVQATDSLLLDIAAFYNRYEKLRSIELGFPLLESNPLPLHFLVPARTRNNLSGITYGIEATLDWRLKPWWSMKFNYAFLEMDLRLDAASVDLISAGIDDSSPEQQASIINHFDLPRNTELDVIFRYVDELPSLGVDDYLTLDVRLGWRPTDDLEFSIVGHDLLDTAHGEFESMFVGTLPTDVQRGVYGKLTWKF